MSIRDRALYCAFCTLLCLLADGFLNTADTQPLQPVNEVPDTVVSHHPEVLNGLSIIYVAYTSPSDTIPDIHPGAELRSLTFENGSWVTSLLVRCPDGWISDPDVSANAETVVFAMKDHFVDSFHLYSYNIANHDVTQLTHHIGIDDTAPVCLPDGSIIFSSTRDYTLVTGTQFRMPHLYRMGGDGSNIHRIGAPGAWEDNPVVISDGRILYERGEDSCTSPKELWTMFPSGTKHTRYWQCTTFCGNSVTSARPIGKTDRIVCLHDGVPVVIDRESSLSGFQTLTEYFGFDENEIKTMPTIIESVHPIDEQFMLVSGRHALDAPSQLYLAGSDGLVLLPAESAECRTPVPLRSREFPSLHTHRTYTNDPGTYYSLDMEIHSPSSSDIEHPSSLRIFEYIPTRLLINESGELPQMGCHNFRELRLLGDVPVEEDGSTHFTVPAEHMVAFQLVAGNGRIIDSMATPTMIQPGEITGCIGCHDSQTLTPPVAVQKVPNALLREPSQPSLPQNNTGQFDFVRDIQPIFTGNCLQCHSAGNVAGSTLDLSPDRTIMFSVAYEELWRNNLITDGSSDSCMTFLQPFNSSLLDSIWASHKSVILSPTAIDIISSWITCGAPFSDAPRSPFPDHPGGRSPLTRDEITELSRLCSTPYEHFLLPDKSDIITVNFDRPYLSGCLAALRETSGSYRQALAIIETGRTRLSTVFDPTATPVAASGYLNYATEADAIESQYRAAIENDFQLYDGETELVRQPPGARQ